MQWDSELGLSPVFSHLCWQGASSLCDAIPVSVKGDGRGIPAQPASLGTYEDPLNY